MKKIIIFFFTVILLLNFSICALANGKSIVSADDVSISEGTALVPVSISENSGIMGFKISLKYPSDLIEIVSVTRGAVTSEGNFNTDIGMRSGYINILWNNTQDVKANGTLFTLAVKEKTEINDTIEINVSYSQPDTFNENWEDVVLDCKNIIVLSNVKESTTQNETTSSGNNNVPDDTQIINAVKITLEKYNLKNLSDVTDTQQFILDYNKAVQTLSGSDKFCVSDFGELVIVYETAYKNYFISYVEENLDINEIKNIIDESFAPFGVSNINDLEETEKIKFVETVENKLKNIDAQMPDILTDTDIDAAVETIEDLIDSSSSSESNIDLYIIIVVVISAIMVAVLSVVLSIYQKKIRKNNN